MSNLRTIDKDKLEAEIDKRSAVAAALAMGRPRLPIEGAIQYSAVMAEHNALVAVFNSLR